MLAERGALVGATDHVTTKALYAHDPDGIEFEVCWLLPADRIDDDVREAMKDMRPRPLDLAAEIARYGADTRGGVGVSIPTADPRLTRPRSRPPADRRTRRPER